MNKKRKSVFLCLILCVILFTAHFNAVTASAAPLGDGEAMKIMDAIQNTQEGSSEKLYSNLTGTDTVFIRSFEIKDLEAPKHGSLLDNTATVVADNGASWEIPVLWVDRYGDVIHIAIEIDNIARSYPVFVFYMPEGISLMLGENTAYKIDMPDFVAALMKENGVTALSIPEAGRTYISTMLPDTDRFKLNYGTPPASDSKEYDPDGGSPAPSSPSGGSSLTPPTDNDTTPPDPGLSEEEEIEITDAHCSPTAIRTLGVEKLAALVTWVKKTLEPEAANLLVSKFPAYQEAEKNEELGRSIGLYICYDPSSTAMASVDYQDNFNGDLRYRLTINSNYFYVYDNETQDYVFDATTNYSTLDNTLVHEMMHAFMDDYTRAGMTGMQHDETKGTYDWDNSSRGVEFPRWFTEGIASTVDNTFQFRNTTIHDKYGFVTDVDPEDENYKKFTADELVNSYIANSTDINITAKTTPAKYVTGYLATLYLGYMAAKSQNKDAISGDKVDSSVIRFGENYILKSLHEGKTLDDIIAEISVVDGEPLYENTRDFEKQFISGNGGDDGRRSADFCVKLLNYMEKNSKNGNTVNGSVLLDFADTNTAQLYKNLLKQNYQVYVPTDDKEYALSTVDKDIALDTGGKRLPGTIHAEEAEVAAGKSAEEAAGEAAKDAEQTDQASNEGQDQQSDTAVSEEAASQPGADAAQEENLQTAAPASDEDTESDVPESGEEDLQSGAPASEETPLTDAQQTQNQSTQTTDEVQGPQNDSQTVQGGAVTPDDGSVQPPQLIISESEPEPESQSDDSPAAEQVLDAVPEQPSGEDRDINWETLEK